jgi:hypothetical protein
MCWLIYTPMAAPRAHLYLIRRVIGIEAQNNPECSSMCETCESYDVTIHIHSPAQLRNVLKKLRQAVMKNELHYNHQESQRVLSAQVSFMSLNLSGQYPDVLCYYFSCPRCGNSFALSVETYHGRGGSWTRHA